MLNRHYLCKYIDTTGSLIETIESGNSKSSILERFESMNLRVVSVTQKFILKSPKVHGIKVNRSDLILFTNTIFLLCSSKLSISQAISVSRTAFKKRELMFLSEEINMDINNGCSFSNSIIKRITNLPAIYKGLIQIGEKSGNINTTLSYLDTYLKKEKEFKEKLTSALIYPTIVLILTLVLSLIFSLYIVPKINTMYTTLGGISDQLVYKSKSITLIVQILGIIIISLLVIFNVKSINVDKLKLKIPIIGKYIKCHNTYLILFTISTLTRSGFPVESGVKHCSDVVQNLYFKRVLANISNQIIKGSPLSAAFKNSPLDNRVESFMKIGEESGSLTSALEELSRYYETENSKVLDSFVKLLDPIITLLVGSLLIGLVLTFILPVLTKMGEFLL